MTTKQISRETTVDLSKSRCVWATENVELWADEGNVHVWAETNGDPVYSQDELRELLSSEGLIAADIDRIVEGDLSTIEA